MLKNVAISCFGQKPLPLELFDFQSNKGDRQKTFCVVKSQESVIVTLLNTRIVSTWLNLTNTKLMTSFYRDDFVKRYSRAIRKIWYAKDYSELAKLFEPLIVR